MQIVPITSVNKSGFLPMIPRELLHDQEILFGAIDGGTGCGLAAYEIWKDRCVINWIWVAPPWRGEGIGSALLDAVCEDAFAKRAHVQLCYRAAADGCELLDLMLLRRGFLVTADEVISCEVTGEELLNSPLMKHAKPQKNRGTRILPFSKVEPYALRACAVLNEEHGNYQASRADYVGADVQRSMVLLVDTKVRGCVLVHPDGEPGCLRLAMFYLDEQCANMGISFLRTCVAHSMELPEGIKKLRILAASNRTKRMVTTLLGDVADQTEQVHEAHCYREQPASER